jgi:hypothetical protein
MSIDARRMLTTVGASRPRAAFAAAGAGGVAAPGCGVIDGTVTLAPRVESHRRADLDCVFEAVREREIAHRAVLVPCPILRPRKTR